MAHRFLMMNPYFYDRNKLWWFWNENRKCYEKVDETDLINELRTQVIQIKSYNSTERNEILNALRDEGRKYIPKPAKKTWVQFADVIVDYETYEKIDPKPNYFITNPLPYKLGENDDTPTIDELFKQWVGEKYYSNLYEILAYCMITHYPIHRIFVLLGEGRNGKGSFLKILEKFMGEENGCSSDFGLLIQGRFERARLYKKLYCQMGEINSSVIKKTNILKMLSGEDSVPIEFKGKDGFDFHNYAKIIIATNKLPESIDKTIGFFSRWMIIDFPNQFNEKSGLIEQIPDKEFENLCLKCLNVLKALLERFKFCNEGSYEERAERYEERASTFNEFMAKYIRQEFASETALFEVYEAYVSYCSQRGIVAVKKSVVSAMLKTKGFDVKVVHVEKDDGSRTTRYVVVGLVLEHVEGIEK